MAVLKRQGAIQTYHTAKRSKTVDARLRNVERVQAVRKPELKRIQLSANTQITNGNMQLVQLTGIAQGNHGYERNGNEIRIKGVIVRGELGAVGIDAYLIQGHSKVAPTIGVFNTNTHAPFLLTDYTQMFTEWDHYRNLSGTNTGVNINRFFQYPMKVSYTGALNTDCVDNLLYLVLINRTGANVTPSVSIEVLYTDS